MNGEISNKEIKEINKSGSGNFREIKPKTQMSDQEVEDYWKSEFKNAAENFGKDTANKRDNSDTTGKLNEQVDYPIDEQEEHGDIQEKDALDIDSSSKEISDLLADPKGIEKIFENNPENQEVWKSEIDSIDVLNDPDASPVEIMSAKNKLNQLKGDFLEAATKDVLKARGLDVQENQHMVKGELGNTIPDVVATNNSDQPIDVLGRRIDPGDTLSAECKCGTSGYMKREIGEHIPKQLAGQEGSRTLIATSDINEIYNLAEDTCSKYDAKLITLDVSVADVERAIKGMTENENL